MDVLNLYNGLLSRVELENAEHCADEPTTIAEFVGCIDTQHNGISETPNNANSADAWMATSAEATVTFQTLPAGRQGATQFGPGFAADFTCEDDPGIMTELRDELGGLTDLQLEGRADVAGLDFEDIKAAYGNNAAIQRAVLQELTIQAELKEGGEGICAEEEDEEGAMVELATRFTDWDYSEPMKAMCEMQQA
jgi:hypothetical protein